jgi:diguanylate cyclase (GGDEF)-like protein
MTHVDDAGLLAIEQLCELTRDALGASRVVVWRYAARAGRVSPVAGAGDEQAIRNLTYRWSNTSIEDVPPFDRAFGEHRAVVVDADELRGIAPGFARELAGGSIGCYPLSAGERKGLLTIEPAPASVADEHIALVSAGISALLTWQRADRGRAQAELLLELIEAAASHSGSLGELLGTVCEQVALQIGVTRASIFLASRARLTPRMSRFADGTRDPATWERFRVATEPFELAETAFAAGRPAIAEHPDDPALAWWAESFQIQAALAVPLGRPRAAMGVLTLESTHPRTFRSDQVRLVAAAGALLGAIIQRAQAAEERELRVAVADSVRDLLRGGLASEDVGQVAGMLARIALSTLATEQAVVCLGHAGDALVRAAYAEGEDPRTSPPSIDLGSLARSHLSGPVAVESLGAGPGEAESLVSALGLGSGMVIPLVGESGVSGVLVCGDSGPRAWTERRLEVASQLGLEGGLVLEAAKLRELDRARERELDHRANHDALTGLANRPAFYEELERVLAIAARRRQRVAVMLIDLNGFKEINDSLGHLEGDRMLAAFGARMRAVLGPGEIAARLGGDEFAVAICANPSGAGALALARRMLDRLTQRVEVGDMSLTVDASIGVALFPDHGDRLVEVLGHADTAMYVAKRARSGANLYSPHSHAYKPVLTGHLRRAISEGELQMHFQPKVELAGGRVTGVEALMRWAHPTRGIVGPGEFIPVAEASGLIGQLTQLALSDALEQCRQWESDGLRVDVAVNAAAHDISDPAFPKLVARALDRARVAGERLVVELTESCIIPNERVAVRSLAGLRDLGVRVSLDDFGTGYSSLQILEHLPVDELKLDRSFLPADGHRSPVAPWIVGLAHELGLTVVAEGVETDGALRSVAAMGCDHAQGYYLARPMPAGELRDWIRDRTLTDIAASPAFGVLNVPAGDTPGMSGTSAVSVAR